MDIFEELRAVAVRQSEEADFPLWLLPQVLELADNPELYSEEHATVELLLSQLKDFDAFAGAGCFDTSVSTDTIRRTLRLIMGR